MFGFPRTDVQFMKNMLSSVKKYLVPNIGQLHLLIHVSGHGNSSCAIEKRFEIWDILDAKVSNNEWKLVARESLSLQELKSLFPDYQART